MTRYVISLFCSLCILTAPSATHGQSQLGTGAISGTVQDTSAAVIGGAVVTVTNAGTGLVRSVSTNDAGQFSVPVLPAGEYKVVVEREGFSSLEQTNLTVNVGRT